MACGRQPGQSHDGGRTSVSGGRVLEEDGIRPADQREESSVRQRFSDDVVGRSVAAVKNYWAQLVFSGRELPPPELENDEEVVRFVAKNAGGVGYVSPAANVERVKVLTVR
jgi:hypothetical protein